MKRVFEKMDAEAFNKALYESLEAMPPASADDLPEVPRGEREQRRSAAAARRERRTSLTTNPTVE